jgi:putative transposase
MWQTDFTYLKVIGWGRFYLSTILDDYPRYVIGRKLCRNMQAEDVTDTLDIALAATVCDSAKVPHRPRTLSDNGSSSIAEDRAKYLEDKGMQHVRCASMHPTEELVSSAIQEFAASEAVRTTQKSPQTIRRLC